MTVNEYLDLYKTGIEIGIVSVDELVDFIYNEIERLDNVPFCYIDVLEAVPKGVNAVIMCINSYFLECHYAKQQVQQSDNVSLIERILIGRIAEQYKSGETDIKTTVYNLGKLSSNYRQYHGTVWDSTYFGFVWDIFDAAERGMFNTMEDVHDALNEVFEMAVYEYL